MSDVLFLVLIVGYILIGRAAVLLLRGRTRDIAFGLLNVAALYVFFFQDSPRRFAIYLGIVSLLYLVLVLFAKRSGAWPWLAFFAPILVLVTLRYIFPVAGPWLHLGTLTGLNLLGISYLAFRSSHLVLEVRNDIVPLPSYWQYLGFCFFAPTLSLGPINPYSNHLRGFAETPVDLPEGRCLMRIVVGLVKFQFLGSYLNQLSYDGLLLDNHYHHFIDLPIASISYFLYLYCNFSGFCDVAIGAAGLMKIPVAENFQNPLAARNIKEFWNRWHITLSTYMRDVAFSPLSKFLVRLFGPRHANHAIAVTIVIIFIMIGIWHGVGWNFVAYGVFHAVGVAANHYYAIWLKKRLGRERFKAYIENREIHAVAVVMTFCYAAASLFLFANNFAEMRDIFASLR